MKDLITHKIKTFKPGDHVFIGNKRVKIIKQVLANPPSYRVKSFGRSNYEASQFTVDGRLLLEHPVKS